MTSSSEPPLNWTKVKRAGAVRKVVARRAAFMARLATRHGLDRKYIGHHQLGRNPGTRASRPRRLDGLVELLTVTNPRS